MRITGRFNTYIRAIAFVLLVTFILQDIVYANPDLLLKSSTLAQRTLQTSDNKPESLSRFATAYFDDIASRDPRLEVIENALPALNEAAVMMGISDDKRPLITGDVELGAIKIAFSSGDDLVFYDPDRFPGDDDLGLSEDFFRPGRNVLSDRSFGRYLQRKLLSSAPSPRTSRIAELAYRDKQKALLMVEASILGEAERAVHVFDNTSRSRSRKNVKGVRIVDESFVSFKAETLSGVIYPETVKNLAWTVEKALAFKWIKGAREKELRSILRHLNKILVLSEERVYLLGVMDGDKWRAYRLPDAASEEARQKFVYMNACELAIRLRYVVLENPSKKLGPRLLKLAEDVQSCVTARNTDPKPVFTNASRALFAISRNKGVDDRRSRALAYISERLEALAVSCHDREPEPVVITDANGQEMWDIGASRTEFMLTTSVFFISFFIGVTLYFGVGHSTVSSAILLLSLVYMSGRLAQEMVLDRYLNDTSRFLKRVRNGEAFEEEKIRDMFIDVIHIYKSPLVMDLVEKRKKLLVNLILINVMPPEEEKEEKQIEFDFMKELSPKVVQSIVRSKEARRIIVDEVFASTDPVIFQPGLEAVIEVMARYPKWYYPRVIPLLERSQKLPRFAKALVDILIKAEHGKVKLFEVRDKLAFFDEVKAVIVELASRSPGMRKDVTAYLLEMAKRYGKETPLAHDLLDRIGFYIVGAEEFPRTSAGQVAETILKIQKKRIESGSSRRTINMVLTAGNTMEPFLAQLRDMLNPDIWQYIHVFQVCEYKGYTRDDPESVANFLDRNVPVPEENKHFMDGASSDERYVKQLKNAGGADIVVLGLGRNGRIGFNEPGHEVEDISGEIREVSLSENFPKNRFTGVPIGYTMTLEDILKADNIFLLAEGKAKAEIVKKALFGAVSADIPASKLQNSKNLTVVLDTGAMERVAAHYQNKSIDSRRRLKDIPGDVLDTLPGPQHRINRNGVIEWANEEEAKMLGYTSTSEIIGSHVWDLIDTEDVGKAKEAVAAKLKLRIDQLPDIERRFRTKSNKVIWVRIREKQILNGSEVVGIHSLLQDITEDKKIEKELAALVSTDSLTGARNSRYFTHEFPQFFNAFAKTGKPMTLAVFSIDGLKEINGKYGFGAGNAILETVALNIRGRSRRSEDIFIRYAGNRLLLVLPNTNEETALSKTVGEIMKWLSGLGPISIKGETINFTVSAGVSSLAENDSIDSLLLKAEKSLAASRSGTLSPEDRYTTPRDADAIVKNVERIVPLLVSALAEYARRNPSRKVMLALDKGLGPTGKVRELIHRYITSQLAAVNGNNDQLRRNLENLVVIDGEAVSLSVRLESMIAAGKETEGPGLAKESIFIITTGSGLKHFSGFEGRSFITAIDGADVKDAEEEKLAYYPLVEIIFFAFLRALCYEKDAVGKNGDKLWRWYRKIPNIKEIDKRMFLELIYDKDSEPRRTVILKFVPSAAKFDYQELDNIYQRIQDIIRKA